MIEGRDRLNGPFFFRYAVMSCYGTIMNVDFFLIHCGVRGYKRINVTLYIL
jgi:hypothetical protein